MPLFHSINLQLSLFFQTHLPPSSSPTIPCSKYLSNSHEIVVKSSSKSMFDGGCMRQRYNHGYRSRIENAVWIVSAVFIVYFGDCNSNLIHLLCHDDRIRRLQMYIGLFGVILNVAYFLYTGLMALDVWKSSEDSTTNGVTFVTIMGLMSFCLICFALWPIWSFFTLPLVFTLLMASMVVLSLLTIGQQASSDIIRID